MFKNFLIKKTFLTVLLSLVVGLLVSACSEGIFYTALNPDHNQPSTSVNTTPMPPAPDPTPTPDPTPPAPPPLAVTATEIPVSAGGARPFYAAFSVKTNQEAGVITSDYYLALRLATKTKPTAAQIKAGLHYQRNLSSTPINIYAWGALDTVYAFQNLYLTIKSMMLTPASDYVLYGLPKDGTDEDVVTLGNFSTSAIPLQVTPFDTPSDTSIFNGPIFSVRIGEPLVYVIIYEPKNINGNTEFTGPPSSTVKPSNSSNIFAHGSAEGTTGALYQVRGTGATVGIISDTMGSFMQKPTSGNEWWLKTELN